MLNYQRVSFSRNSLEISDLPRFHGAGLSTYGQVIGFQKIQILSLRLGDLNQGPGGLEWVKLATVFQLFSLVKSWSFINFYTSVGRIPYRTTLTGVCCKPYFTSISGGVKETLKVPQKYRKLVVVNNAIP